jgi:hypothetical protein
MVTCKLWAGTANQLFMISATICHALRMNTGYAIPRKTINPKLWRTYIHHLPEVRPGYSTKNYFRQPDHSFTAIPNERDITLEGYFQSEQYWYEYKEELANILGFKYEPSDYVAVHMRRGDYLLYPDRFPVLPSSYYQTAIDHLRDKEYDTFRVFSDDIPWCKSFFGDDLIGPDIQYSIGNDSIQDIKDMFCAKAFVIANSSFSLFPALLRTDNPLVIAPAEYRWFGPKGQDMNSLDRMPGRFIKI